MLTFSVKDPQEKGGCYTPCQSRECSDISQPKGKFAECRCAQQSLAQLILEMCTPSEKVNCRPHASQRLRAPEYRYSLAPKP